MDAKKKILVFVSHKHGDHLNPKVFDLRHKYRDIEYVLSSDIEQPQGDELFERITYVEPEKQYELNDGHHETIRVTTLKSTDLGVAFLLNYIGKTVYHAGDLNLWVWKEETKQYNEDMTAAFSEQMDHLKDHLKDHLNNHLNDQLDHLDDHLKDTAIDVAFVPLDPRQEEYYHMGMERLLSTAKVKIVFPMHFGKEFSVIERYKKERAGSPPGTLLMDIVRAGQEWEISL